MKQSAKKALKWTLIVFATLFLLLALMFATAVIFIDEIVKCGIEKFGPEVTGVPCEIEDISISLSEGRVEITNLKVGVPPGKGYAADGTLFVGKAIVDADIHTLFDEKLVLEEITVKDVCANFETTPTFQESNVNDILNNVKKYSGEEKKEGKSQKLQLNKLVVDNVKLQVMIKHTPAKIPLVLSLPELGPLGEDKDGLTAGELTEKIAVVYYDDMLDFVKNNANVIVDSSQNFLKNILNSKPEK